MSQSNFEGVFNYLKAITFANLAGGFVSFISALVIFVIWKTEGTEGAQSLFDDALNVGIFLFPVGLMYSLIIISPIAGFLKKRTRAFHICTFIAAVAPSILLFGSGYWGILALSYGVSTALLFIKLYSVSNN